MIEPTELPQRSSQLRWDSARRQLFTGVVFRDAISADVRAKLSRGLPTTVVMTALLYASGQPQPIATTVQSCKTTWHVWEEMYRVELTRPNEGGRVLRHWTPTLNGVLRRCAQASGLLVASSPPAPAGPLLSLRVNVQVNPLGEALLQKIQHWITLPARATPANPGGALLGTFTRLFMARVGEAEYVAEFTTSPELPETEGVPIR